MSDLMFYGVLQMPYEMAMSDELSRFQFYSRVQEAVKRLKEAERRAAPTSEPVAVDRDSVLEEAAAACEAWGNEKVVKWADDPDMGEDAKARAWDALCCANAIRALKLAAPAAQEVPAAPQGYKVVPLEPTVDMLVAGQRSGVNSCWSYENCYRAMLAAAPEVPAPAPVAGKGTVIDYGTIASQGAQAQPDATPQPQENS